MQRDKAQAPSQQKPSCPTTNKDAKACEDKKAKEDKSWDLKSKGDREDTDEQPRTRAQLKEEAEEINAFSELMQHQPKPQRGQRQQQQQRK